LRGITWLRKNKPRRQRGRQPTRNPLNTCERARKGGDRDEKEEEGWEEVNTRAKKKRPK